MHQAKTRWSSAAFHGLFFLSGAAGLAWQMAWTRMFANGLGHEVPAVLAVLAAIFGGMAAGAWLSERLLAWSVRPGRCYGWLEVLSGGWGLVTIALIPWCNQVALSLTGLAPTALRQWLVAFILPGLVLSPATVAMGATFPAIEQFLAGVARRGCVGGLYAANTLGALAGVLLSAWVIIPTLGFARALAVFSAVALCCGGAALLLQRRWATVVPAPNPDSPGASGSARLAVELWTTGLLGIGYEVLGVRVLAQVLENTVYTFAATLAVYLLGNAVGAALYQRFGPRMHPESLWRWIWIALSTASMLGVWILSRTHGVYALVRAHLGQSPLGAWWAELLTAGTVFIGPTVLMGATFAHLVQSAKRQGLSVGSAVAWNTFGSAMAPVLFGVMLLPSLGAKWAFVTLGLAYLLLGWPWPGTHRLWAALPVLVALMLPAELRFISTATGDKVLSYSEGVSDSVAVLAHADGNRSLLVDNRFSMGGTGAAMAERRHASLPLLLHPHPQRALFLGLGTGITFAAAAAHPDLQADGVELVPEIVQALPWFEPQNALPTAPGRFKIYSADARRFIHVCPNRYDVIVADLFHPARDGAGALYSIEHFRAVREQLAVGGLFCQWLPLFQLDDEMLRVIARTFLQVFPNTRAFLLRFNVDTPVLGLIGNPAPTRYRPDYYEQRVTDRVLRERLAAEQVRDGVHLFGCFVAGADALRRFASGAPLNTDDQPVVIFGAPRFYLQNNQRSYDRLLRLLEGFSSDPGELIEQDTPAGKAFAEELSGFISARNVYLKGLAADSEGRTQEALNLYLESVRLSPLFQTAYAHCVTLAMQQAKTDPARARHLLQRLAEAQPNRPLAAQLLERLAK